MARVLLVLTAPAWRGSGLSFAKIATGLQGEGHQVAVVAATAEVAEALSRSAVQRVMLLELPNSGRDASARLTAVKEGGWDLVITDSPRDVRLASSAKLGPIAWRFNLPNRPVPSDLWSRWLFRRVTVMVYQSHFAARLAAARAPWLARISQRIIANGYDTDRLVPDLVRGLHWRERYGIAPDAPLLVTTGALSPEKALPETITLGRELARRCPGLRQVLVGSGEMQESLKRSESDHLILTGELPAAEALDALRAATLVVQLSPNEIFPNVVAEAMAVGGVVVGAATGATPEVVGGAGVLLSKSPAEPEVTALVELLQSADQRRVLGEAARERVATTFPLGKMVAGYAGLIRSA